MIIYFLIARSILNKYYVATVRPAICNKLALCYIYSFQIQIRSYNNHYIALIESLVQHIVNYIQRHANM